MDMVTRYWTAALIAGLGIAALIKPGAFFAVQNVFRLVLPRCSADKRDRLQRVLEARQAAEGVSDVPARIMGACGVVAAAMEFVRPIDFVLPYALICLSGAVAFLVRYLQVKRATERRVAVLARRSPYDSLSPLLIACVAMAAAGTAMYLTVPGYGAVAAALLIYIATLGWIAWRLAASPAFVQGIDPELEYAVDNRLRKSRVAGVITLACAPPAVLVALTARHVDSAFETYAATALLLVAIGCVVALTVNTMRKFSRQPLNGVA